MLIFYGHVIPKDITVTRIVEYSSWRRQRRQEHNVFNQAEEMTTGQSLGGPHHWFYVI